MLLLRVVPRGSSKIPQLKTLGYGSLMHAVPLWLVVYSLYTELLPLMINVPLLLLIESLFKLQETGINLLICFLKLLNKYKIYLFLLPVEEGKEVLSPHLPHIFSLNVVLGLSVANYLATTPKQIEKDPF